MSLQAAVLLTAGAIFVSGFSLGLSLGLIIGG